VALQVEHVAAPIVGAIVPGAQPVINVLNKIESIVPNTLGDVIAQEELNPASGAGASKSATVQQNFELMLFDNLLTPVLAARGETVSYDHAALIEGISGFVTALNAMAKVKSSIKIVPIAAKPA